MQIHICPDRLTLRELDELAEKLAKDEVAQQRAHQGHRHAEHAQQHVRYGQIEQEQIGYGAHATVLHQGRDDQQIAQHGAQQDHAVAGNQPDGHLCGTAAAPAAASAAAPAAAHGAAHAHLGLHPLGDQIEAVAGLSIILIAGAAVADAAVLLQRLVERRQRQRDNVTGSAACVRVVVEQSSVGGRCARRWPPACCGSLRAGAVHDERTGTGTGTGIGTETETGTETVISSVWICFGLRLGVSAESAVGSTACYTAQNALKKSRCSCRFCSRFCFRFCFRFCCRCRCARAIVSHYAVTRMIRQLETRPRRPRDADVRASTSSLTGALRSACLPLR